MQNVERSWLEKIINDPASTEQERAEAQRQLAEADAGSQRDQDRLLIRYLNSEVEAQEFIELPEATVDLCHALTYWPLGLDLPKMAHFVNLLVALHGRTQNATLRAKCEEAVQQWLKLAKYYHHAPGAEKAARHAAKFLERNQ